MWVSSEGPPAGIIASLVPGYKRFGGRGGARGGSAPPGGRPAKPPNGPTIQLPRHSQRPTSNLARFAVASLQPFSEVGSWECLGQLDRWSLVVGVRQRYLGRLIRRSPENVFASTTAP